MRINIERQLKRFKIEHLKLKYLQPRIRTEVLASIGAINAILWILICKDELFNHTDIYVILNMVFIMLASMQAIELPIRAINAVKFPSVLIVSPIGIHVHKGNEEFYLESSKVGFKQYTGLRYPYCLKGSNILGITDETGAVIAYIEDKNSTIQDEIKDIFSIKKGLIIDGKA